VHGNAHAIARHVYLNTCSAAENRSSAARAVRAPVDTRMRRKSAKIRPGCLIGA